MEEISCKKINRTINIYPSIVTNQQCFTYNLMVFLISLEILLKQLVI